MPWYSGNFHCHSTNSDGTASPLNVALFYKAIGMDFVTVSDHNALTPIDEYRGACSSEVTGIPCCEYTGSNNSHVLGVDVTVPVAPNGLQNGWTVIEILQDGIDKIRDAGGVAVLCHPGWNWAYTADDVLRLEGVTHFEVFNAGPDCNSHPIAGRSAPEEMWDRLLTAGVRVFGVADDDAHWYGHGSEAGMTPNYVSFGGTGWCVVKAPDRSARSIRDAFEAGHFYASTGVMLSKYLVTSGSIEIEIEPRLHQHAAVEFIGAEGTLLDRQIGLKASYKFSGSETYVRTRITDTSGCFAFTQPVFLDTIEREITWTSKP